MDSSSQAPGGGSRDTSTHEEPKEEAVELAAVDTPLTATTEKEKEKPKDAVPVGKLFRFATKLDGFLIFWAIIMALGHGALQPLFSVVFGNVINAFGPGTSLKDLVAQQIIWFTVLGAASFVSGYFQSAFFLLAAERQSNRIRREYFRALLRQDMAWYDAQEAGAVTARISGDVLLIREGIGDKMGSIFQFLAMFLGGFAVAFTYSWKLSLVCLAAVPLLAFCGALMGKIIAGMSTKGQQAYAKAGGVAEEVISSIRTVAAFGGEQYEALRYGAQLLGAEKAGIKKGHAAGAAMGLTFFIMFGSYGLAFWYGSQLIVAGEITAGTVVTTFFAIMIGSMSLGQMAPPMTALAAARGAAFEIFKTIDRVPVIDTESPLGDAVHADEVRGDIQFRNVQFAYPTRPNAPIMRGFDLQVHPGTTVALVGPSGCGKSTAVQLLQRFYDPIEGAVLLDGKDIKDLNLQALRSVIGVVAQEPVLFDMSIAENISFGGEHITREQIERAARMANAYDFVMALEKGFDTRVGERGSQLSGGQKQRIAIARALVRNPKILLLDEATSALDNRSEKVVQSALDNARRGRTTIVIAHRLTTIRDADMIAVVVDGQVQNAGTHDELLKGGGLYKELWDKQAAAQDKKRGSKLDAKHETEDDGPDDNEALLGALVKSSNYVVGEAGGAGGDEESATVKEEKSPLWRAAKMNGPEWPYLLVGSIAACAGGIVFPCFSLIYSELLADMLLKTGDELKARAAFWALIFLALAGGAGICNYLQGAFFNLAGERLTSRIRSLLFTAIIKQDVGFFDFEDHRVGALATKLSTDATLIQGATSLKLGQSLQTIATLVSGLVIAFVACWRMSLVVLACIPVVGLGGALRMKAMMGHTTKAKEAYEKCGTVASEAVSQIRTVAALGRQDIFMRRYNAELAIPEKVEIRSSHLAGIGFGFSEGSGLWVFGLAFWYGSIVVTDGQCAQAEMFKAIMAIIFGAMMAGQIASMAPDAAKARTAAVDMFKIVDRKPPIDVMSEIGDSPETCVGELQLNDVVFRYPSRTEGPPILRGMTLTAHPGQTVALVGASGCGKSTAIQLLERFYDPAKGRILIDGRDMRSLNLHWVRRQIGFVQQEPVLFSGSIADNIRYGDPLCTMDQIVAAATMANASRFIEKMPEGYHTQVGERGAKLSGGQKQRVAIARALVRNPKILLLDEATSALDSTSEKIVQEALDRARRGRTTLVIAHRLSTVRDADVIAVIDQGAVAEMGTHDSLMARQGAYYNLVTTQAAPL